MPENTFNHPRGTVCVGRMVGGKMVALAIHTQWWYAEWPGCFSVL